MNGFYFGGGGSTSGSIFSSCVVGIKVCRFLFCYTHFGNTKLIKTVPTGIRAY